MTANGTNTNTDMIIRTVCMLFRTFGCLAGGAVAASDFDVIGYFGSAAGRKRHIWASRPCATRVYVGLRGELVDGIVFVNVEDIEDVIG